MHLFIHHLPPPFIMPTGAELSNEINVDLSQQETYDTVLQIIIARKKSKFSVETTEPPNKIVAYGGRGPSKFAKAVGGMVSMGIGTALMHYSSPKRVVNIFFKNVNGATNVLMLSEGWTDRDSRVTTFINSIMEELIPHKIIPNSNNTPSPKNDDPLTSLKSRFAKGEISAEEFTEMKKMLEE